MAPVRFALLAFLVALVPATAAAHPGAPAAPEGGYQWGMQNSPTFSAAMKNIRDPKFEQGPCTEYAKSTMPAVESHDHTDISQHRFQCNMEQVAFNSLTEVFGANRADISLGEMDVKGDLAVVATAYPESGFLLFDVSDSSRPKFLSWYRGDECEGVVVDVDCGAFVDLSPDGKRVYISVQQISVVPGGSPAVKPGLAAYPGVDVVDISNREAPTLTQKLPVVSVGGVHTTRSFDVPGKGEYTVSVANSVGAMIHKLDESTGTLEPVGLIEMDELHDTFIQQDPLTGKTLLYIAGGFDSGFYIFDVSDPASPVGLGEWDPTPECEDDWYAHTLDVTTVDGRRIVTLPVELIDFFGDQSTADQEQGCGKLSGNGDFAGPLFIVDATDFSKLGAIDTTDDNADEEASDMKAKSEAALITVWSNAAGRAGGRLTFSPHNQQIVGNRIYLSGYHSGITVLDATKAFQGENVRPKELGVIVPHGADVRPIHPDRGGTTPAFDQFFTSFIKFRPIIWDMQFHRGQVLAADMVGGFYALRLTDEANARTGDAPAAVGPAGEQVPSLSGLRLALRLTRNRELGRRLRLDLRGEGIELVRAVSFRINGRRVAADLKAPFRRTLRLSRREVRRKTLRIAAKLVLNDGTTLTLRRTLRTRLRR